MASQHITTIYEKNVGHFATGLVVTSLVLMASLAWNNAFQDLFNKFIPSDKWEVAGKFLYALLLTAIVYYAIKAYLALNPSILGEEKTNTKKTRK